MTRFEFDVEKVDGNVVTYHLTVPMNDAGVYRYGFRLYPKNPLLPHRMDFAYTRWV
ncbi:MAG: hypothetical protein K2L69_00490 [Muribaculaceae bacterium]|nr:hypothetical protein [Muribaculaceae bacterium]